MGRLTDLLGQRVYLDTNIVVYAVEGVPEFAPAVRAFLRCVDSEEIHVVTSLLTLAEVLVKPKRDANNALVTAYKEFLSPTASLTLSPISWEVLDSAASIRAERRVKLPDAIHLATCCLEGCSSLLTNDSTLAIQDVCRVVLLSDIAGE
ncbi:MAG: PIN domain-containing protein [Candidatus Hydrogenedentes bacterium]|nr:PIN domain-containing protein [Candidatus Hydrogenedentota bacterium]